MQVDLFKSRATNQDFQKIGHQIETRQFAIDPTKGGIDDIRKHVNCCNTHALDEYVTSLKNAVALGRKYNKIGQAGCDSLFEVEALGIALYAKQYTMILDFSDSLDYILHRLSRCDMRSIRNIPDYRKISNSIMNFDFSSVEEVLFETFFQVDPKLDEYFKGLLENSEHITVSSENKMNWVIGRFYIDILEMAARIKDYTMTYFAKHTPKHSFAYRSKSFSAALGSSDHKFDSRVVFTQDGFSDYALDLKFYEPFDYVKGRVFI